MVDRLVQDTGSHIRHAGDSQDFHAAMPGDNHFWNSRHAHCIRPNGAQEADLGRSLIAWARDRHIHAFADVDAQPPAFFQRHLAKSRVIGFGHVDKADAEAFVVGADQRIAALKIDVVFQDHQAALLELQVDSTGSVGQQRSLYTHARKDTHGKRDSLHGIAFIVVDAARHHRYRRLANLPNHQISSMANGAGAWEVGNRGIRNHLGIIELFRERPQARAQYQSDPRTDADLLFNKLSRLARLPIFIGSICRWRSHYAL